MAKSIIIIEDTDKAKESFEIKVLKFQSPDELDAADTSAILLGDQLADALAYAVQKMRAKTITVPMQSEIRH